MPIQAVKIPQNVYVEDRIIGPVTLRQLTLTGIGAGLGYMLYAAAIKSGVTNIVFLVLCWVPTVIAAAFAFLRINDLSLLNIIFLFLESINKPNVRYWSPHPGISINLITGQSAKNPNAETKAVDAAGRLAEATRQLEKRQEEINHLAARENPNPDALEPVQTQMREAEKRRDETHAEASSLPVDTTRVQSEGLDPLRSIDGIGNGALYERLIAKNA